MTWMSRKQLFVLQPTSFCNINCKYCYLPHRNDNNQMSFQVMERIFDEILKNERFHEPVHFVWHAGEPLTVQPSFYRTAFDLSHKINEKYNRHFFHSIQTNGTLINQEWIELFQQYDVTLGVSLDGPSFIHDNQRMTRSGKGTHGKVMRGVNLLQKNSIKFNVIMVLTRFALDYPDEIFQFFAENGIKHIGFNIDELEGSNKSSSFEDNDSIDKYRLFMKRFLHLVDKGKGILNIREFNEIIPPLVTLGEYKNRVHNSTNTPLSIVTFNYQGDFSTFCPELSGTRVEKYHDFIMGNILTDSIEDIWNNPVFKLVNEEIQRGVNACKKSCEYWDLCGGGSPANKFFEKGCFDITETLFCKVHKQTLIDVTLDYLENKFSA